MNFIKMHGLGNDFMVLDGIRQSIQLSREMVQRLARRDTGVGFDQCLIIEKSRSEDIDFFYRIFNADGKEVGQCGNGARALARFIHYVGLSDKKKLKVATKTTALELELNTDDTVTVTMGRPAFIASEAPLRLSLPNKEIVPVFTLDIGNPHAVSLVDNIEKADVATIGQWISEHPHFLEQTNAGFMQVVSPNRLSLRVYERGCGETKACGSGAVAAAAVGRKFFNMEKNIQVDLPGGTLNISWASTTEPIFLTGPATFVYEGRVLGTL